MGSKSFEYACIYIEEITIIQYKVCHILIIDPEFIGYIAICLAEAMEVNLSTTGRVWNSSMSIGRLKAIRWPLDKKKV